jgi:hypothetical protein
MLAFVELHFYPMSTKQKAGHKACFLFWLFLFGFIPTLHLRACADYGRWRLRHRQAREASVASDRR